jgi:centrosomal protein CEP104
MSDQFGISILIGDYRTRCLFSKVWGLREAVINKVKLLLEEEFMERPGLSQCISALCAIVRVGIDDKLSQLMFSAIPLLDDVLSGIKR